MKGNKSIQDLGMKKNCSVYSLKRYFTPVISVSNEENYINTCGRYVSLQLFLKQHDIRYDYKKSDHVVKQKLLQERTCTVSESPGILQSTRFTHERSTSNIHRLLHPSISFFQKFTDSLKLGCYIRNTISVIRIFFL